MTKYELFVVKDELSSLRTNIKILEREQANAKSRADEEWKRKFVSQLRYSLQCIVNILSRLGYQVYFGEEDEDIDIMVKPILASGR